LDAWLTFSTGLIAGEGKAGAHYSKIAATFMKVRHKPVQMRITYWIALGLHIRSGGHPHGVTVKESRPTSMLRDGTRRQVLARFPYSEHQARDVPRQLFDRHHRLLISSIKIFDRAIQRYTSAHN
jgi:hypothetical protein